MPIVFRPTLAAAAVLAAMAASGAHAAVHSYTFTAQVNPAYQGLDLTGANADVTGSFSFDDAVAPSAGPYPQGSAWYPALLSFSFTVGPQSGTLDTLVADRNILIRNDFDALAGPPLSDAFSIQPQAMSGNARGGFEIHSAYLYLNDSSATALGSSALPTAPLALSGYDTRLLYVQYGNAGQAEFYATVTSISAVPEPEQAALLLAGLGALGVIARRRGASRG